MIEVCEKIQEEIKKTNESIDKLISYRDGLNKSLDIITA